MHSAASHHFAPGCFVAALFTRWYATHPPRTCKPQPPNRTSKPQFPFSKLSSPSPIDALSWRISCSLNCPPHQFGRHQVRRGGYVHHLLNDCGAQPACTQAPNRRMANGEGSSRRNKVFVPKSVNASSGSRVAQWPACRPTTTGSHHKDAALKPPKLRFLTGPDIP